MNDLHQIASWSRACARPQPGLTADQPPGLCALEAGTGIPLTLKETTAYATKQSVRARPGPP